LIDGWRALSPGCGRGPLIEAMGNTEKPLPLEKFLRHRPDLVDSAGRTLYRAYAFALMQMLLDGKNGGTQLAKYIDHLSDSSDGPLADLKAQFPVLADDAERTWQLALNRLKSRQTFRLLTFAESEQRLDELLRVKISEPKKPVKLVRLDELTQHKLSASEKMALDQLKRDLMFVVPQTNPVLRPIGREYQEAATQLARGTRSGVQKRLSRLELTRQQLAARMTEIDDHRDGYIFLRDALDFTTTQQKKIKGVSVRHVTGPELLDGVRQYALKEFGPMVITVFDSWGIQSCEDIGHMVFNLIGVGVFGKTEEDSIKDFKNVYDFKEAFVRPFAPTKAETAKPPTELPAPKAAASSK